MRVVRAHEHRVMPWKNGGGSTTQIAIAPEHAALDDFDWRVSMAPVVADGAFSSFPGIDRTLLLLTGEGIELHIAGREPTVVRHATEPLSFPGDVATRAVLLGGPIVDLNVMTRRGRFTHEVMRCTADAPLRLAPRGDLSILLSRSAAVALSGAAGHAMLGIDDAAFTTPEDGPLTVTPSSAAVFFVIALSRVG